MEEFLLPHRDIVFRILFGSVQNEDVLSSLLTASLRPARRLTSVKVLNPEVGRDLVSDRGIVLDVRVQLEDGSLVDVEMQMQTHPGLRGRFLHYWAKLFASQATVGGEWRELRPTYSVIFLGQPLLRTPIRESIIELTDRVTHERFTDLLRLHLFELGAPPAGGGNEPMDRWLKFLAARSMSEVEEVAMEDADIMKAKVALEALNRDPAAQWLVEARECAERTWRSQMTDAREDGEARGEARGKSEGTRGVLVRLMTRRFGALTEQQLTCLNEADLSQLEDWSERIFDAESAEDLLR